jgi:hypothetical protein
MSLPDRSFLFPLQLRCELGDRAMPEATSKILTFEEIQHHYDGQWVLIADVEVDETFQVIRGEVLAHSTNRDDIYKALSLAQGKSVTLEYIGTPAEDWAVML